MQSDKWSVAHLGSDIGNVDAGHEFAQETVQFRTFDVAIAWNHLQKLIIKLMTQVERVLKFKYGRTLRRLKDLLTS